MRIFTNESCVCKSSANKSQNETEKYEQKAHHLHKILYKCGDGKTNDGFPFQSFDRNGHGD